MEPDSPKIVDFKEHVRLRPKMYIGNDNIIGLIKGLIIDCFCLCKTDKIKFEISLLSENKFSIKISSKFDITPFILAFTEINIKYPNYFPSVLYVIANDLVIDDHSSTQKLISFSIDKSVIEDTNVDYLKLDEEIFQIALLNRNSIIITIDKRRKYVSRNCYHFPEGILYLFRRAIDAAIGTPVIQLIFDGCLNSHEYQIALAYRTDWFPQALIGSFANEVQTICGGSLVDGIIDGLLQACKKFAKERNLASVKIKRKKIFNELILICAVKGDGFIFGGSWKETLENDEVKKEAKQISENLVLEFFRNHDDIAKDFLTRFDTSDQLNILYR